VRTVNHIMPCYHRFNNLRTMPSTLNSDYGISGVFHMRFMQDIGKPRNYEWKTRVMRNVRAAAESTGRVFAVSYNIAGGKIDDSVLDELKRDWKNLVDNEKVTQSGRYIHHNGLPVLRIYGIGFKAVSLHCFFLK
jgi:hypothetical protein